MGSQPDYVYDPDDWEYTIEWSDRDFLVDDLHLAPGEMKKFETLVKGPPRFFAEIVVTRDEAGFPDETEGRWFDSEEEARAAITSSEPAHV